MNPLTSIPGARLASELQSAAQPALALFYQTSSPPSRALTDFSVALAGDLAGELRVFTVNLDDQPELASRYQPAGAPAFVLFAYGIPLAGFPGTVADGQGSGQREGVRRGVLSRPSDGGALIRNRVASATPSR